LAVNDVVILLLLAGIAAFWWQQDQFHRRALALAKQACERAEVQLLDDSVGMRRLRLVHRRAFELQIIRTFGFEFSQTGAQRYSGSVVFAGRRVQAVDLDLSQPLAAG